MRTALISVSDKTGVTDLALRLLSAGYRILSTGGTGRILREIGIPVTDVSEITGFPESLDGRVKSLHPAIHAGILARRDNPSDMAFLAEQKIDPIDLVVVSLYPFAETVAREDVTFDMATEMIDVGGPTLIRAAAKNYRDVTVICHPDDYAPLLEEIETDGEISADSRYRYALRAYEHTAAYDALVARYFREQWDRNESEDPFPQHLTLTYDFDRELPDVYAASRTAIYRTPGPQGLTVAELDVLHGQTPDAADILSADLALQNLEPYIRPAICAVADNHLIGIACGTTLKDAWDHLYSAHASRLDGALIAMNEPVDDTLADDLAGVSMRALLARAYLGDAVDTLSDREDLTLYIHPTFRPKHSDAANIMAVSPVRHGENRPDNRQGIRGDALYRLYPLRGALLVAPAEHVLFQLQSFEIASERQLERGDFGLIEAAMSTLRTLPAFSALIWHGQGTRALTSNQATVRAAVRRVLEKGTDSADGILVLSNALTDPDLLEPIAAAGIRLLIEPGTGSPIDEDKIAAANDLGLALCFTGSRLDEASGGMIR